MQKKPKFNPEIARVKLNPEQAVLNCSCYDAMQQGINANMYGGSAYCAAGTRIKPAVFDSYAASDARS